MYPGCCHPLRRARPEGRMFALFSNGEELYSYLLRKTNRSRRALGVIAGIVDRHVVMVSVTPCRDCSGPGGN